VGGIADDVVYGQEALACAEGGNSSREKGGMAVAPSAAMAVGISGCTMRSQSLRWAVARVVALVAIVGLMSAGSAEAAPSADERKPFDAEPVRYAITTLAEPGGRVVLYFEVKNTGSETWTPASGVALVNVNGNPLGAASRHGLRRSVLPNETFYWDFEATAPRATGVHQSIWQVRLDGMAAGPAMTAYVVVVPKEAKEQRARIEKLIDEFRESHGHEVDQLVKAIADILTQHGANWLQRLLQARCGLLSGIMFVVGAAVAAKRQG